MIEYTQGGDLAVYNGLKYRRDKHTGYYLNAKTHKRLHVAVYENEVGAIPAGYHVHHIDHNKDNNEPGNLRAIAPEEHEIIHGKELTAEQRAAKRANIRVNAAPAAAEWHGTEAGREFHSELAKNTWKNREPEKAVCTYCGTEFLTVDWTHRNRNRFCSNKCKAAFRRASGADDVAKICERCGHEYTANKYQKTKYCQDCKGHRH